MASAAAPAEESRRASLTGAGLLPDADTLIRSAEDPLVVLEYHRHFTHALVTLIAVALIAVAPFWVAMRRLWVDHRLPFGRVYGYALLGASRAVSFAAGLVRRWQTLIRWGWRPRLHMVRVARRLYDCVRVAVLDRNARPKYIPPVLADVFCCPTALSSLF